MGVKNYVIKYSMLYVIGIDFHDEGLMSIVNSVMTHIEYALDRGYTPVVNMKDFQSIYGSPVKVCGLGIDLH